MAFLLEADSCCFSGQLSGRGAISLFPCCDFTSVFKQQFPAKHVASRALNNGGRFP